MAAGLYNNGSRDSGIGILTATTDKGMNPQFFYRILLAVLAFRFAFAAWIPMTGDEAYFIVWGKHLDYGYYDHTPMVGWLLSALLLVSDAAWWLRLPSVILPVAIAYFIFRILLPRFPQTAAWVALAYLLAPVNLINVLITTDTPLIFFSFVSAWFFYQAMHGTASNKDFLLAGLFLGLAFFSKYFAVFLGFAYGLYIILFHRTKRELTGLGLILLMVMPFVFINLLWNYNHCWNNILFNLFNRTSAPDNAFNSLVKYIVILIYLLSPVLVYFVIKNSKQLKQQVQQKFNRVYSWLVFLPLLLFLLLTIRKEVGLHWLFSFYPFVFIAFAGMLNVKQWRWTFHFMWIFGLVHVIAVMSILLLPVETFANKKEAVQNLVFGQYPQEVLAKLKAYEKDYTFATISYGMSSVASYYSRKHFIVFDKASFHAREDERLVDYKKLSGKNILIFKRTPINLDQYSKYFASSERKTIKVREATFELLVGNTFNYELYHKEVLQAINSEFYSIPDWLPVGRCEFKEKYNFSIK